MTVLASLLFALAQSGSLPGDEGELANRSFLPKVSPATQTALAEFRANLQRERGFEAGLALARALENADIEGELTFPSERLGMGLRESLERSLAALPRKEGEAYARLALDFAKEKDSGVARDEETLRRIARNFPGSPSASRALETLGELAFERGDFLAASSFFRRSRGEKAQAWMRRIASTSLKPTPLLAPGQAWQADLAEEKPLFPHPLAPCATERSIFTQTGRYLYEHDEQGRERLRFLLDAAIFERDFVLRSPEGDEDESSSWPSLQPQWVAASPSRGRRESLILVHRAGNSPPFARRIVSLSLQDSNGLRSAQVAWQRGWGLETGTDLEDFVLGEGFLVREGRIFLQAHRLRGDSSCFALCLDAESGKLLWKRFLGKGAPAADDPRERLRIAAPRPPSSLAPLLFPGTALFATNLGLLTALDPADGAYLWALRTDRAKEGEFRWKTGAFSAQDESIFLAPEDSGWVYRLTYRIPEFESDPAAYSLFESPPFLGAEGRKFLGQDGERSLFLENHENAWRIFALNRNQGTRENGVWLRDAGEPLAFDFRDSRLLLVFSRRLACFDGNDGFRLVAEIGTKEKFQGGILLPSGIVGIVSKRLFFLPREKPALLPK